MFMKNELRMCLVTDKEISFFCYFHCWEQNSRPVPSDIIDETPAGIRSSVYGIVETPDGHIHRVPIEQIKFVDDISTNLYAFNNSMRSELLRKKN